MVDYEVLGFRRSQRTSKSSGNVYQACNLYLAFEDNSVNGIACSDIFCRGDLVPELSPGDHVHVFYNRFGSVEAVEKVG